MKKKNLLISFLCVLLFVCFSVNSFAASITIAPGAEEVIFNPTDKDLFEDFKNMMPGDVRTQKIALVNSEDDANITVYMRAEVEEADKDFLRWYKISVYLGNNQTDKGIVIAENVLSVEGNLKNDVKIATLTPGQTKYITVMIECDKQMSNDYALKEGTIHWIFSCEEELITTKPTEPTSKPTTEPTTEPTTKPTTEPTTRPTTTKPTTTAPSTTRPTTTKPTTASPSTTRPTTAVPTTKPEEPTTKRNPLPFTGSDGNFIIPVTALAVAIFSTIIVLANTKRKAKKNET